MKDENQKLLSILFVQSQENKSLKEKISENDVEMSFDRNSWAAGTVESSKDGQRLEISSLKTKQSEV